MSGEPQVVMCRVDEDETLFFLCGRCGTVHNHGSSDGNRLAHCRDALASDKYGVKYETYYLRAIGPISGSLADEEIHTVSNLLNRAHDIVEQVEHFLKLNNVSPNLEVMQRVKEAELTLRSMSRHTLADENPLMDLEP